MNAKIRIFLVLCLLAAYHCASSVWREGFSSSDTLQLVGQGNAPAGLTELQTNMMAREAAVMDAMSHWPKYCGDPDATNFRIENQRKRFFECAGVSCRARVVIEKANLREKCSG